MNKSVFALGCALLVASPAAAQSFVPSPPVPSQTGTVAMTAGAPRVALCMLIAHGERAAGTPAFVLPAMQVTTK